MTTRKAPPSKDLEETVAAMHKVSFAIKRRIHAGLAEQGLTIPQWLVIATLHNEGRTTARELAAAMCVTPANVTGILDRLERDALISRSRSEEDRRVVYIRLTEKGHEKWRSILMDKDTLAEVFADWTDEDHKNVRAALKKARVGADESAPIITGLLRRE